VRRCLHVWLAGGLSGVMSMSAVTEGGPVGRWTIATPSTPCESRWLVIAVDAAPWESVAPAVASPEPVATPPSAPVASAPARPPVVTPAAEPEPAAIQEDEPHQATIVDETPEHPAAAAPILDPTTPHDEPNWFEEEDESQAATTPAEPGLVDKAPTAKDPPAPTEPRRRWIDLTGSHAMVGHLIEVTSDGSCVIEGPRGRVDVPLESLSPHDRAYATEAAKRLAGSPGDATP